jgi:hypothetical protein
MVRFEEQPHPWIEHRHQHKPPAVNDERAGLNGRIGLWITEKVGTMWCAYVFAALALISLPAAILSGNVIVIVAWIAQTFFQLVLLPVIIVGQNIQATASDKRAAQTYKDAEAILHECLRLQRHLQAQDKVLDDIIGKALPQKA